MDGIRDGYMMVDMVGELRSNYGELMVNLWLIKGLLIINGWYS